MNANISRYLTITYELYLVVSWRVDSYMNLEVIQVNSPFSICKCPQSVFVVLA